MADTSFLTKSIGGLPAWGWGVIIVIGAGIGYFVLGKTKTSTPNQSTGTNATPTVDSATVPVTTNNPIGPYPVVPGGPGGQVPVLPPGMCPVFDNSGNVVAFGPCPPAPGGTSTPNAPPVTPSTVHAKVRPKGSLPGYDTKNPGGVPIRSSPGNPGGGAGPIMRLAPYGSTIIIDATPVTGGANNFGKGNTAGSPLWYKVVAGGYISAYDLVSIGST